MSEPKPSESPDREAIHEAARAWRHGWFRSSPLVSGDLRVLVTKDFGSWFAQGMEIDYFSASEHGGDADEATERFEEGLRRTLKIQTAESMPKLLRPAPEKYWTMAFAGVEEIGWTSADWLRPWFSGIRFYRVTE